MRILIIGAGSMGCLVGAKLSLANYGVLAIGSPRIYKEINKNGLIFHDLEGQMHPVQNFKMVESISTLNTHNLPEICIITCKAYSLPTVLKEYASILSLYNEVFLLQNGLGNEDLIGAQFPNLTLYRIISSFGATLKDGHHIYQTGEGSSFLCCTSLSPLTSPISSATSSLKSSLPILENLSLVQPFMNAFGACRFPISLAPSPLKILWEKAIINCAINPLGTLWQLPNGLLMKHPQFWETVGKLVEEILQVAQKLGILLESSPYYLDRIRTVLESTQANKNSMFQDIENHRPTEIDFLNGYITQMATKCALSVPQNEQLVAKIKIMEND
ncbi:MAG: ketopantoate reductase family protein [Promethearchaeota archaeon]